MGRGRQGGGLVDIWITTIPLPGVAWLRCLLWRTVRLVCRGRRSTAEGLLLLGPVFGQRPDHGSTDGPQESVAGLFSDVAAGDASAEGPQEAFLAFSTWWHVMAVLWLPAKECQLVCSLWEKHTMSRTHWERSWGRCAEDADHSRSWMTPVDMETELFGWGPDHTRGRMAKAPAARVQARNRCCMELPS